MVKLAGRNSGNVCAIDALSHYSPLPSPPFLSGLLYSFCYCLLLARAVQHVLPHDWLFLISETCCFKLAYRDSFCIEGVWKLFS